MPPESPGSSKEDFCGEAAMIVLLTGESGCGKTTLCARVVASLKARGLDVAGVLTLPRFADGEKIGMDVEDVRTGERGALAERAAVGAGTANLAWKFDDAGLARGAQILRDAPPCDVLVIDELGPLELIHNVGWIVALDVLQTGHYRAALVVVRPGLVENFQARLKLNPQVLTLTALNREELFDQIVYVLDPRISANPRKSR
jgi:nucleoside-triphosphatase THEP1